MTTRSGHPDSATATEPAVGPASPSGVSSANQPLPLHGDITAITPGSLTIITLPEAFDVAAAEGAWEHLKAVLPAGADVIMMVGTARTAPADQLVEVACEVLHIAFERAAMLGSEDIGWEMPWGDVPDVRKAPMRAAVTALFRWMASGNPA